MGKCGPTTAAAAAAAAALSNLTADKGRERCWDANIDEKGTKADEKGSHSHSRLGDSLSSAITVLINWLSKILIPPGGCVFDVIW